MLLIIVLSKNYNDVKNNLIILYLAATFYFWHDEKFKLVTSQIFTQIVLFSILSYHIKTKLQYIE